MLFISTYGQPYFERLIRQILIVESFETTRNLTRVIYTVDLVYVELP